MSSTDSENEKEMKTYHKVGKSSTDTDPSYPDEKTPVKKRDGEPNTPGTDNI
jgi:hypothetical protein